ncbi:MAG: Ada metal-binding domain-containing protein [Candidatus Paceibacterales bacterium]
MNKKLMLAVAGVLLLGFTGSVHADVIGNKDSKFFFPENCSYVKLIKKANVVTFKTAADAVAAGYKASSKCKSADSVTMTFVGNKSSKLFFPANCSYVKLIKVENKVVFNTFADALAAGYKASSKCSEGK